MENPKEKRFCGSGRIITKKGTGEYAGISGSLCLDDFLESDITTGKNGKRYLRFALFPRSGGPDNYGNDHYAVVDEYKKDAAPLKATPQVGVQNGSPGSAFSGNDEPLPY